MRLRGLVLAAALLATALSPASATMRIAEDRGGQIGHYLQAFALLRSSGERVVIDGNCLSACTLVLGLIPHESDVRHAARALRIPRRLDAGRRRPSGNQRHGNAGAVEYLSRRVRRWINHHGGLSRRMIYMQGRDLQRHRRRLRQRRIRCMCAQRHRYAALIRYESANAASDRR